MGRSVVTTQDLCGFLRNREDMPFTARQSGDRWVLDILDDVEPSEDGKLWIECSPGSPTEHGSWIEFAGFLHEQQVDGFYIEPNHPQGCVVQFT